MFYAVYDVANGRLVSTGDVVADPLPAGLAKKEIGRQMAANEEWDATALAYRSRAPRTDADRNSAEALLARGSWTQAELHDAIRLVLKRNFRERL
jgi:hypothetical protein